MNMNSTLSLILCSRNDSYMGNTRWRLETTINLTLKYAKEAGVLNNIEILVSDWGSDEPLRNVLSLINEAEGRVKFLHVPQEIAIAEQKDSKFPEVLALNAVARRAHGNYIGRIDNDTIIGKEFFTRFFSLLKNPEPLHFELNNAFLFVERKSVPYRFSSMSYPLSNIELFLCLWGNSLKIETAREFGKPFWWSPVGIMLFHRKIWHECHGYDERLLYWGWMEGDLALRLQVKHPLIDFCDHVGNHFFHLEHYTSMTAYKDRNGPATPRKKNPVVTKGLSYKVNDDNWGLKHYKIDLLDYDINQVSMYKSPLSLDSKWIIFPIRMIKLGINLIIDNFKLYSGEFVRTKMSIFRIRFGKIKEIISNSK